MTPRDELIEELTEAERILNIISGLEISEGGIYTNAGAVMRQLAKNYFDEKPIKASLRYFAARSDAQGERAIVGWCVHTSSDLSKCAMYNTSEKADALDAAKRWGASMTAVCLHPDAPALPQWKPRKGERRGDNDEHEEQIAAAFAGREPVDRTGTDRRKSNAATQAETDSRASDNLQERGSAETLVGDTPRCPENPLRSAVAAPDAGTPETDALEIAWDDYHRDSKAAGYPTAWEEFARKLERQRDAALIERDNRLSPHVRVPDPFVVRHYEGDEHPSIKGNGFDGLSFAEERNEVEEFITFVNNAMLAAVRELSAAQAESEVLANGLRTIAQFALPHAERDHEVNATHDSGVILNEVRSAIKRECGNHAVNWMVDMKQRTESAESRVRELEAQRAGNAKDCTKERACNLPNVHCRAPDCEYGQRNKSSTPAATDAELSKTLIEIASYYFQGDSRDKNACYLMRKAADRIESLSKQLSERKGA